MSLLELGALVAAGLVMGALNNLAGAAGALGLVALEEFAGLDALSANATLRPSAVAIGLSGWLGFASRGQAVPKRAWLYGLAAIPGAAIGACAAMALPEPLYRATLFAILVVVLWQQLRRRQFATASPRTPRWVAALLFVLVGLHMGFLQVGFGLLAMAVLGAVHSRDLVEINAAKMALIICTAVTAVAVFLGSQLVAWGPGLALAAGCGVGSYHASRWSVARGHAAVRVIVVVITIAILVRLALQTL